MFEWSEEIFLESEVCKFSFLYKLHGKLSEGVYGKEGDVFILVTPNLEMYVTLNIIWLVNNIL